MHGCTLQNFLLEKKKRNKTSLQKSLKVHKLVLVFICLVCFRIEPFHLKSIQVDGIAYCFIMSKLFRKFVQVSRCFFFASLT